MFDTVFGLPTHTFVVHAAVVFIPLAAAGAALLAVGQRWRRPLRWWVVLATVAATVLVPVATESGEQLEGRVGKGGLIATHAERGAQMIWFMIPLLVLVLLLVWLDSRRPLRQMSSHGGPFVRGRQSLALKLVALLTVAAAAAAVVQVVRVGHSGSTAVWKPVIEQSQNKG